MAIHNPSSLYSGGVVTVNSQPATQFYLQSIAKKRAKDEALDNYYRDFNKSLNTAGMRNQDIEGWMGKVNDWRGFYQQNREAIKNPRLDNGKAQSEYMSRYQDALSDVQRSKNRADLSAKYVLPIITNPDKRTRLTDNSLGTIASHDKSIYDPEGKDLDPTTFDFDAKPFGLDEQKKLSSFLTQGVKMDEMIEKITTDPKTQSKKISYEYKLNPAALQTVGARAANTYESDDRFQAHIDQLAENPEIFNQLNEVFKGVYGKDIVSNKDFAAAYGLNQVQKERDVQKVGGYNQWQGYSAWGKPNQNMDWPTVVTQEAFNYAQTGSPGSLDAIVNHLSQGNGKYRYVDYEIGKSSKVPNGQVMVIKYHPINSKGEVETEIVEDGNGGIIKRPKLRAESFELNDPVKFKQDITGFEQNFFGSKTKDEDAPNYTGSPFKSQQTPPKTKQKTSTKKSDPLGIF